MTEPAGVTIEDVRRVAELANLELTAEEEPRMQRDLNAILGHIAQLNELDRDVGGRRGWRGRFAEGGHCAALSGSWQGDGCSAGNRWPVLQSS
jgi:hypothetical protein